MPPKRVREEGFSKDADKLVRRLSLVALLLSRRGQPVSVAEIRSKVEGYPTMTEEAFKRRFYEDRDELAELGIEIRRTRTRLRDPSELYSLPADAYYLAPIELDGDELTALAACLAVLEDRFAYSQPLRLALLSLAQGRPELIAEAEAPPLTVVPEAHEPCRRPAEAAGGDRRAQDGRVRLLRHQPRRGDGAHRRPVRPAAGRRRVVPHRLVPHARGPAHLPPLAHPLARHAPHAPAARLRAPADFDLARLPRPSGVAAGRTPRHGARPRLAGHGLVGRGALGPLRHGGAADDGGIVYETPYADARPLLGWVLGLADEAELLEPADLRAQLRGQLGRLAALLDAPPPERPSRRARPRRPPRPGGAGPTPT